MDAEDYKTACTSTDAIVIRKSGDSHEIFLIKRKNDPYKGHLAFPAGTVEYGEDPKNTVLRGLKEGCGIVGRDPKLANVSGRASRDPRRHLITIFYSVLVSEAETIKLSNDIASAKWYKMHDIWTLKDKFAYDFRKILWEYVEDKFPQYIRSGEYDLTRDELLSTGLRQVFMDRDYPVTGSVEIMCKKKHGTSDRPVMDNLRFGVDPKVADEICNFNRNHAAEAWCYAFSERTTFEEEFIASLESRKLFLVLFIVGSRFF